MIVQHRKPWWPADRWADTLPAWLGTEVGFTVEEGEAMAEAIRRSGYAARVVVVRA